MEKVKKHIKEAKGQFFKRLSKTIFDERVESYHLKALKEISYKMGKAFEDASIVEVGKRTIQDYVKLNELIAIYRVVKKHYQDDIDTHYPDDVVNLCESIRDKYINSFWKAMAKNIGVENYPKHQLTAEKAYLELIYRGFKPNNLLGNPKTKTDYYITSTHFGLNHPIVIKDQFMAREFQSHLGIRGYVGYHHPISKK